jgi:hypothetical protein
MLPATLRDVQPGDRAGGARPAMTADPVELRSAPHVPRNAAVAENARLLIGQRFAHEALAEIRNRTPDRPERLQCRWASAKLPRSASQPCLMLWGRSSRDKMVAMSWSDRLSRVPIPEEQVVEGVARAIYSAHRRAPAPEWERASDNTRDWVRVQAREAMLYMRTLTRPTK